MAGAAHHLLDLVHDVLGLGPVGGRVVDVELDLVGELRPDLESTCDQGCRPDDLHGRVEDQLAWSGSCG